MTVPDILGTIAEVIITMAGFMGVVVAFNQSWSKSKEMYHRIQWTFTVSLAVLVSLFTVHFLAGYSDRSEIVFGLPLAFLGLSYLCVIGFGLWQQRTGRTTKTAATFIQTLLLSGSLLVAAALLLSSMNILIPRTGEMLILGATWSIVVIASAFVSSIWHGMNT